MMVLCKKEVYVFLKKAMFLRGTLLFYGYDLKHVLYNEKFPFLEKILIFCHFFERVYHV